MEQAGVEPDRYTYTVLLNCLARRRKIFDGFQVVTKTVVAAPIPNVGHRCAQPLRLFLCALAHRGRYDQTTSPQVRLSTEHNYLDLMRERELPSDVNG